MSSLKPRSAQNMMVSQAEVVARELRPIRAELARHRLWIVGTFFVALAALVVSVVSLFLR